MSCQIRPYFNCFFSYSLAHPDLHSFPTRRSSDLLEPAHELWVRLLAGGRARREAEGVDALVGLLGLEAGEVPGDRKSTRLNSSHTVISYAVFCLKKKSNTKVGREDNS